MGSIEKITEYKQSPPDPEREGASSDACQRTASVPVTPPPVELVPIYLQNVTIRSLAFELLKVALPLCLVR